MVEIVNINGRTVLESRITVDLSLVEVLKNPANKTRIKNILNDLNLHHILEEKNDQAVSIAARIAPDRLKAKEVPQVEELHIKFLEQLEDMQQQDINPDDMSDEEFLQFIDSLAREGKINVIVVV